MKTVIKEFFTKEKIEKGQYVIIDRKTGFVKPYKPDSFPFLGVALETVEPSDKSEKIAVVLQGIGPIKEEELFG